MATDYNGRGEPFLSKKNLMTRPTRDRQDTAGVGLGIDKAGNPVVDPTENVIALTEAANKRQDDLRGAQDKYVEARIKHVEQIGQIRAKHSKEMRKLESDRLNAIRQVDVTAVKTEADRALQAIQALAATTAINAETLRTALTNTAATIAKQTSDTVGQLIERIAALEKSSYEGVGKSRVADPQLAQFMIDMKGLVSSQRRGEGKAEGAGSAINWVIAGVGVFGTLVGLVGTIVAVVLFVNSSNSSSTKAQATYTAPAIVTAPVTSK